MSRPSRRQDQNSLLKQYSKMSFTNSGVIQECLDIPLWDTESNTSYTDTRLTRGGLANLPRREQDVSEPDVVYLPAEVGSFHLSVLLRKSLTHAYIRTHARTTPRNT